MLIRRRKSANVASLLCAFLSINVLKYCASNICQPMKVLKSIFRRESKKRHRISISCKERVSTEELLHSNVSYVATFITKTVNVCTVLRISVYWKDTAHSYMEFHRKQKYCSAWLMWFSLFFGCCLLEKGKAKARKPRWWI